MQMLFVSESYQTYQNGAVSNQLTDVWKGGGGGQCVEGDCDIRGVLYYATF